MLGSGTVGSVPQLTTLEESALFHPDDIWFYVEWPEWDIVPALRDYCLDLGYDRPLIYFSTERGAYQDRLIREKKLVRITRENFDFIAGCVDAIDDHYRGQPEEIYWADIARNMRKNICHE